ncbi:hypothetical protein FACS189437_09860 [Bacteroidia bacterium]|nr:hypothetical protein FACS189437_09860 [Bacteroidia bacterium]
MKTYKSLIIFCMLVFSTNSYSQKISVSNPSPEAASSGIVKNIPVNYHTGRVNISIPLMDIKANNYSIPVELSYNSLGFMPNMRPTWIGQNWNLDVGGVITRVIKGLPDEIATYGLCNSYDCLNNDNWASDNNLVNRMVRFIISDSAMGRKMAI